MDKKWKNKLYAASASFLAFFPVLTLAQSRLENGGCSGCVRGYGERYSDGYGMMGSWGMGWGGLGIWSAILGVIFWVAVIFGIIYLIKNLAVKDSQKNRTASALGSPGASESAVDILKKRYAKGEISKEEFEKMRGDLV